MKRKPINDWGWGTLVEEEPTGEEPTGMVRLRIDDPELVKKAKSMLGDFVKLHITDEKILNSYAEELKNKKYIPNLKNVKYKCLCGQPIEDGTYLFQKHVCKDCGREWTYTNQSPVSSNGEFLWYWERPEL